MSRPFPQFPVAVVTTPAEYQALRESLEVRTAGAVEFRADLWSGSFSAPHTSHPVPRILTARRGGGLSEPQRATLLRSALAGELGVEWVDLDADEPHEHALGFAVERSLVRILASVHAQAQLEDGFVLQRILDLLHAPVRAVKFVLHDTGMTSVRQAVRLGRQLRTLDLPATVISGGAGGLLGRISSWREDLGWGYFRPAGGRGSAAGQPCLTWRENWWGSRVGEVSYLVVGAAVDRSLSPPFHNAILGHRAAFLASSTGAPDELLEDHPEFQVQGLAVTAPYKEWARRVAAPGSPEEAIHTAWNTLRRTPGGWLGWNTDGPACVALLAAAGLRVGEAVQILGGGGAAQGIARSLELAGHPTWLLARPERTRRLTALGFRTGHAPSRCAAVVQASSEKRKAARVASKNRDTGARIALELQYAPAPTGFEVDWAERGARVIRGHEFFAEQARRQASILYGGRLDAPDALDLTIRCMAWLAADPLPEVDAS